VMGSSRLIAMLFIDDPLTPILPWERSAFDSPSRRLGFWRVLISIRTTSDSEGFQNSVPPFNENSDRYSREAWQEYGTVFRTIAAKLMPIPCNVYSVQQDTTNEDFRDNSLASRAAHWELALPQSVGETRAFASRMASRDFPQSDWPGFGWLSGASLFFGEERESAYERRLSTALALSDWPLSYELMMKPRFRAGLLEDLMRQASLYLYADTLAMPESSDPWYFLPPEAPIEPLLSIAGQELTRAGCNVFVSRRINEYRPWLEACRRPSDSLMLAPAHR